MIRPFGAPLTRPFACPFSVSFLVAPAGDSLAVVIAPSEPGVDLRRLRRVPGVSTKPSGMVDFLRGEAGQFATSRERMVAGLTNLGVLPVWERVTVMVFERRSCEGSPLDGQS